MITLISRLFLDYGKLNGANIQRRKECERAIINQYQEVGECRNLIHIAQEEAILPLGSDTAGLRYSSGTWGQDFWGSTVPCWAEEWALFTGESDSSSRFCLGKWKEAVCRPEMVSWERHQILGVRILELMAGVLNLIKPRGFSMHVEGRWLEDLEKVSLKFWMETYMTWDTGSVFICFSSFQN